VYLKLILRRVLSTIVAVEKFTYSEYVFVALRFQHELRTHRFILSPVASLVLSYFSTLTHKWRDFREQFIELECSFDFLFNLCLKHFLFWE